MINAELKTIVFDFDGVLVDSNQLKRDAFFSLFGEGDGVPTELIAEAINTGGSRFEVFRYIFSRIGQPPAQLEENTEKYTALYNREVRKGIVGRGLIAGVSETLVFLTGKYPLYLNSGTPQPYLKESAQALAIDRLFKGIFGKPISKESNLASIMKTENVFPNETLFIGDGDKDWQAAQVVGCRFIGVTNKGNRWKNTPFPLITSVARLPALLTE